MLKATEIKKQLGRVFDDNLHTEQWQNRVDYIIIGMIGLSTLIVFLDTYTEIAEKYSLILHIVDLVTTIFFTIEVSLRIWCANLIDEKYKGFRGRIKYCLSFYGLIDILSTYPFYISLFVPFNYSVLKTLRIMRILRVMRIFRYMRALGIMKRAICTVKDQMLVSLQFLTIITLLLSFILYFVEHEVQPDIYDNGWTSVLWAFMQYLGDPGGFADTPPVTLIGRIIAIAIGILGIAIFAVPAGLIGSAFTNVMEDDQHESDLKDSAERMKLAFESKLDRPTGYQIIPRYLSITEIQARMGIKEDAIIECASKYENFRLVNLACTQTFDQHPIDKLAIEHFPINTTYGCCIDRGSRVTVFSPSNIVDPIVGWWAYYFAKFGGFNFISREIGASRPYKSFYVYKPEQVLPEQKVMMADMNRLLDRDEKWVFTIMAASGMNEPEYPEQVHFGCGLDKGDSTYSGTTLSLNDVEAYRDIVMKISDMLDSEFDIKVENQKYHKNTNPAYFFRHLNHKVNSVQLRVAWSLMCWNMQSINIASHMAKVIHDKIESDNEIKNLDDIKKKVVGYNLNNEKNNLKTNGL